MHLILVSNRMATAKTLTITPRLMTLAGFAFVALVVSVALLFSTLGLRLHAPVAEHAMVDSAVAAAAPQVQAAAAQDFARGSLNAMAAKLGELQAQLMRIDALGERLSKLVGGAPPGEANSKTPGKGDKGGKTNRESKADSGAQGGPLLLDLSSPSAPDIRRALEQLEGIVEQRSDELTALEFQLIEQQINDSLLPSLQPIDGQVGSGFGSRRDPFAGVRAHHEGIDFIADQGTRVVAAAGGVVVAAEYHHDYGNLVDIDHGNELLSRYAHLARIDVTPGQIVRPGEAIGASGSTGRSTGPHLHFEVRYKGVALNPERFFRRSSPLSLGLAAGSKNDGLRLR